MGVEQQTALARSNSSSNSPYASGACQSSSLYQISVLRTSYDPQMQRDTETATRSLHPPTLLWQEPQQPPMLNI